MDALYVLIVITGAGYTHAPIVSFQEFSGIEQCIQAKRFVENNWAGGQGGNSLYLKTECLKKGK